jgi:hypothetical protein
MRIKKKYIRKIIKEELLNLGTKNIKENSSKSKNTVIMLKSQLKQVIKETFIDTISEKNFLYQASGQDTNLPRPQPHLGKAPTPLPPRVFMETEESEEDFDESWLSYPGPTDVGPQPKKEADDLNDGTQDLPVKLYQKSLEASYDADLDEDSDLDDDIDEKSGAGVSWATPSPSHTHMLGAR